MAILKAMSVPSGGHAHANLSGIIGYVLDDEKTEEMLVYGQCLDVPTAYEQMIETKKTWHKEDGVEYFHLIQSFPPNEKITPEQALEQAKKFLESTKKFWGYEVLVAVHKDKEHVHSHFIINSVNFATGKKFHISNKELDELKQLQNNINIRDGYLPAPEKYRGKDYELRTEKVSNNKDTYQLLDKAEKGQKDSYILNCALALLKAREQALSKDEFISIMEDSGFYTEWRDSKKHITFTDIKRKEKGERKCKIRLQTLANYYPEFANTNTKEKLENELNNHCYETERREYLETIKKELSRNRREDDNRAAEISYRREELSNRRVAIPIRKVKENNTNIRNSRYTEKQRSSDYERGGYSR